MKIRRSCWRSSGQRLKDSQYYSSELVTLSGRPTASFLKGSYSSLKHLSTYSPTSRVSNSTSVKDEHSSTTSVFFSIFRRLCDFYSQSPVSASRFRAFIRSFWLSTRVSL